MQTAHITASTKEGFIINMSKHKSVESISVSAQNLLHEAEYCHPGDLFNVAGTPSTTGT